MNGRLKNWLGGEALFFLLESVLVVALAATAAYWTWAFLAPRTIAASVHVASTTPGADGAASRQLFGARGNAPEPASSLKLRLVGVASRPAAEAGRAVFVLDNGKSKAAKAGESIVPGAVLREVHPDHVLLERGGAMERLTLERRNGTR
jgi:general secretion pathway protein C